MPKTNLELKVGIFVLAGMVIFIWIVFSIGNFDLVNKGYHVRVRFNDVAGLEAGAPVELAGVEAGRIRSLNIVYDKRLNKKMVELGLWIKEGTEIRKNTAVKLKRLGLMGEQYVHLSLGTKDAGFVKDNGLLYGDDTISIEDVTEEVYSATKELKKVMHSVNDLVGDEEFRRDIKETASNTRKASANLEEMTSDIKEHPWKLLVAPKENKGDRKKQGYILDERY
ncbi:MAG: MCE family protein [Candidatus Omnitrophica bacterium]|nr:MCE family protein [Candidatus Omnitrophota bacterium]